MKVDLIIPTYKPGGKIQEIIKTTCTADKKTRQDHFD